MRQTTTRGFTRTGALLQDRIRKVGASRGFAVSRLLTHWAEIAGPDIAQRTRPVSVSYAQSGLGGTLTVLTTGAFAPLVDMQKEALRQRVNAVYGYNAISRIRVTQTAPTGFADGQASFQHRPAAAQPEGALADGPQVGPAARAVADGVADSTLRDALARLAQNVLTRSSPKE